MTSETKTNRPFLNVPDLDNLSTDPDVYGRLACILGDLHEICNRKCDAMRQRAAGDIEDALQSEERIDLLKSRLPAEYRW